MSRKDMTQIGYENGYGKGCPMDEHSAHILFHSIEGHLWARIGEAGEKIRACLGSEDGSDLESTINLRDVDNYNALVESREYVGRLINARHEEANR